MSIINEALKKTEASIQKNSSKENIKPDRKQNFKSYFLYILIFIIGLFISNLIFSNINPKARIAKIPNPQLILEKTLTVNEILPTVAPVPLTKKQDKSENDFVLNGIFFSDDDGYALVNNQIIRESDLVDGAKVEKITANTVELNNAGQIITLSTNR